MLPIGDYAGQRRSFPYVNYALIAINVVAFLYEVTLPEQQLERFIMQWGTVPREITSGIDADPKIGLPIYVTLLTSMFLHASWLHLGGNMLYLWVFGDNVEDAMGHIKYLAFYLICGVAGGLAHCFMLPASKLPLIGASGAVAGVIAAYLILHPRVLVWVLAFRFIPLRISAAWVLGVWVATQLLMVLVNQSDQVAWWAHVGGMAAGAILILFMRRPGVPLFDRWQTPA